ncbi:hypothetical protein EVA_11297 [gut metagenome]|uniref:Uncharacterized protein n=1 Tax=gut metagenome TaxID=749906 RepID=J9G054_9ZZZZ
MRDGDAHAVGVGVGGEQEVRLDLVAELEALLEASRISGIRVGAGREVAVGLLLLRDDGHVVDADALEDGGHALEAGAVERGVDDLEGAVGGHAVGTETVWMASR